MISTLKEVLKALKANDEWHKIYDDYGGYPESSLCIENEAAITKLDALIAAQQPQQPQQEPEGVKGYAMALNEIALRLRKRYEHDLLSTPIWAEFETARNKLARSVAAPPAQTVREPLIAEQATGDDGLAQQYAKLQAHCKMLEDKLASQEKAEPVAWRNNSSGALSATLRDERLWTPLYTAPKSAPSASPLTDDEIWKDDEIMSANSAYGANFETLRELVRAVEAAHGIGAKP